MSPGPHSANAIAGNLQDFVRIFQRILILQLDAKQELAFWVQRPRVGFVEIFVRRDAPDLDAVGTP